MARIGRAEVGNFSKKYLHPEVLQEDHHITFYFLKNTEAFVDNETPDNQQEGDVLNDTAIQVGIPKVEHIYPHFSAVPQAYTRPFLRYSAHISKIF